MTQGNKGTATGEDLTDKPKLAHEGD